MFRNPGTVSRESVFPEKDFPLQVFQVSNHDSSDPHLHEFSELVIILKGRGRHITDREIYPIKAGNVFLIGKGMAHRYVNVRGMTLVNILFDAKALRLPFAEFGDVPGFHALFGVEPGLRGRNMLRGRLCLAPDELGEAAQMVAKLTHELGRKEPGYRVMACAYLTHLVGYLSRCYMKVRYSEGRSIMRLSEVLSFIENHYQEPIRIAQLVKMAHMSESSLMRAFKKIMGRSPLNHIIRVRIARAAELLQNKEMRVTEAALDSGFNDSNYFSRQFRQVTGKSPRHFQHLSKKGLRHSNGSAMGRWA